MARVLTPQDCHTLMNLIASEAVGATALTAVDSSSFVSVGESVLNTGVENTLNALSIVIGKTIVNIKPYSAKIALIQEEDTGLYSSRTRRISFYDKDSKEVGWVNTQLHLQNLYNGVDNSAHGSGTASSVGNMWEQDKPVAIEFNFGGASVWDFELTVYPDQLKAAFRDEAEFARFYSGLMTQKQNEIEMVKESFNRMNLLNYMGGLYDLRNSGTGAVDLTAAFNAKYGTQYTRADLLGAHYSEYLAFFFAEIRKYMNYMEERSVKYHIMPPVTRDGVQYTRLTRHTPKADQRLFLFRPMIIDAEAQVLPQIFHDDYLTLPQAEMVDFWQSNVDADRAKINVVPAIPNVANYAEQTAGDAVTLDYVVGVLFDKDACVTNFQFEGADATPMEARKKYQNTWFHNMKNAVNDFTLQGIIFYMG